MKKLITITIAITLAMPQQGYALRPMARQVSKYTFMPASESKIKTVFFDVGNVLLFFDRMHTSQSKKIAERCKKTEKEVYDILFGLYEVLYHQEGLFWQYLAGKVTFKKFYEQSLKDLGIENRKDLISYDVFYEHVAKIFWMNRPMVKIMRQLKEAGYKIGIISNLDKDSLDYIKVAFKEIFELADSCTFSCEAKANKPDEKIYAKALVEAGAKAQESVFIDDRQENVKRALNLRFKAVQYEPGMELSAFKDKLNDILRGGLGGKSKDKVILDLGVQNIYRRFWEILTIEKIIADFSEAVKLSTKKGEEFELRKQEYPDVKEGLIGYDVYFCGKRIESLLELTIAMESKEYEPEQVIPVLIEINETDKALSIRLDLGEYSGVRGFELPILNYIAKIAKKNNFKLKTESTIIFTLTQLAKVSSLSLEHEIKTAIRSQAKNLPNYAVGKKQDEMPDYPTLFYLPELNTNFVIGYDPEKKRYCLDGIAEENDSLIKPELRWAIFAEDEEGNVTVFETGSSEDDNHTHRILEGKRLSQLTFKDDCRVFLHNIRIGYAISLFNAKVKIVAAPKPIDVIPEHNTKIHVYNTLREIDAAA
ncbi:MAG: HAD family phosphatase [Candidatus Omnitrophota bacterium]